jgi:shikimate 5-dehydrogenase
LLVGFVGAGKKTLGLIASIALRRKFIDYDAFFHSQVKSSPQNFIATYGFARYREVETELSQDLLTKHQKGCVIVGLGVTASASQKQLLKAFARNHPVIYVRRDEATLRQFIQADLEKFGRVLGIGNAFFESCSDFDFFNTTQDPSQQDEDQLHAPLKLKEIERVFVTFLHRIFGNPQKQLFSADAFSATYTYALMLSLSQLDGAHLDLEVLDSGADAIQLTLVPEDFKEGLAARLSRHMTTLRNQTRVPIILDARADPRKVFSEYSVFVEIALRVAPDALTCHLVGAAEYAQNIRAAKGYTKLIAVHTQSEPIGLTLSSPDIHIVRRRVKELGFEAIRLTSKSGSPDNAISCAILRQNLMDSLGIPVIAYNESTSGRASIFLNSTLSPVSTPSNYKGPWLPLMETQQALQAFSLVLKKSFVIVGQNVSQSLSPAMHQAAYTSCGLPHEYKAKSIDSYQNIPLMLASASSDNLFGGIAISLPFKTEVLSCLEKINPDAKDINAVNTVVLEHESQPSGDRRFFWRGYNTDYIGIKDCIHGHLSPANAIRDGSTALIVGAGGMAHAAVYACCQLGVRRMFIYNRTPSNAQKLADYYNQWAMSKGDHALHLDVIESINDPWPSEARLPTIVVSCIPSQDADSQLPVDFQISDQWLGSRTGGVFVEV